MGGYRRLLELIGSPSCRLQSPTKSSGPPACCRRLPTLGVVVARERPQGTAVAVQPVIVDIEYAPKSPKGAIANRLDGGALTLWGAHTPTNGSAGGATIGHSHLSCVSVRFGHKSKNVG
jgi:hypothetical protein